MTFEIKNDAVIFFGSRRVVLGHIASYKAAYQECIRGNSDETYYYLEVVTDQGSKMDIYCTHPTSGGLGPDTEYEQVQAMIAALDEYFIGKQNKP